MDHLSLSLETKDNVTSSLPYSKALDQQKLMRGAQSAEILEWWNMLRHRKGTVLLISLAGLLLGIAVTLPQTPTYEARASLEIQDINQQFMNLNQVSPVTDATGINALNDLQTQIKILQSEALTDRTVEKLKTESPTCAVGRESDAGFLHRAFNILKTVPKQERGQLLAAAAKNVKVRAAGQTRIIEVMVDSADPRLACGFANVLISQFIEQSIEARWRMTQRTGDWLGRELEGVRLKLERSEDALQAYARRNSLLYTGEKQSVSEQKLYQLQAELSKAEADRVAKQSRYETAHAATPQTLPEVMNDTSLRDLEVKLVDLRRQKAELSATFKPDYSKSKRVDAQIIEIEEALGRARKAIVDRIGNEYGEAQNHERLLAAAYAGQTRLVTQDSEKAIQYNILKREVDTNRQIYEAMLQRVKESSIASALKPSNIRIVDAAKLPVMPYKPNLPLNAALGLITSSMFGIAGIILMSHADRSLQQPGDTESLLGIPELGVIPSTESKRKLPKKNSKLPVSGNLSFSQPGKQLTEWSSAPSLLGDSFRGVVASILFCGESSGKPRVLVITSAGPGEGKTTASSNLAHAMAQVNSNSKVLLIDADLRKPHIHKVFGLENQSGLADLLKGSKLDEKVAAALIQKTEIDNLDVLTSGSSDSANLFFSTSIAPLIHWCKKQYDTIIIDTPPMLLVPDARMLGPIADAVLLIVRAGQTTRDAALAVYQRLSGDRTRVLGTMLNDWDPKRSARGYYGFSYSSESHAARKS